ncbi:sigma-54-dependent response regulator transcription factor ZraR [soil metagenome]
MSRSILVVEDDERLRDSVARVLAAVGADVRVAASAEAALAQLAGGGVDLVITDVRMPGMSGLELLTLLKERAPAVDIVLMSAYDDLPTVSTAMRDGAADFLVKPLDLHQLRAVVTRVFDDRRARARSAVTDAAAAADGAVVLTGRDPTMVEIFKLIGQSAATPVTVLIRGESGTGKELIARAIHDSSPARAEPFVALNCAALPPALLESELFGHVKGAFTGASGDRRGRFALAGSGTIFLDEIGDTTTDFQSKLLRVLQEHEFHPVGADVPQRARARVITATHRDLEALVASGTFREDLYYRLRVVEIMVPPLRERRADIPALAEQLIARASRAAHRAAPMLASETIEVLLAHDWPGNVRELENCLVRAVVLATGDVIRPSHLGLPSVAAAARSARLCTLAAVEAEHIAHVLAATNGNRTHAAEILGISRPRLRRLLVRHGLARNDDADDDALTAPDAS